MVVTQRGHGFCSLQQITSNSQNHIVVTMQENSNYHEIKKRSKKTIGRRAIYEKSFVYIVSIIYFSCVHYLLERLLKINV